MQGPGLQGLAWQSRGVSRAFVVHGAAHIRAVLGLGCALLSAPGAAGYLGHHGFLAVLRAGGWRGDEPAILDCGDDAGWAWAALRDGMPMVVLREGGDAARAFPGRVLPAAPPARDLQDWVERRGRGWLEEWAAGGV
jgi:hypothetical protein